MFGVEADGVNYKIEKKVRSEAGIPIKTPAPRGSLNRPGSQSDTTTLLPSVARSAMKNIYGVISATIPQGTPQADFCS
jgi:hypothetical protein